MSHLAKAPLILSNHDLLITEFRKPTIWHRILSRHDTGTLVSVSSEIGRGLLSYDTISGLIRVYTSRHSQMRESETRSCRIDNYREFSASQAGLTNRNSQQPQTFCTPLMYHRHTYTNFEIARVYIEYVYTW